MYLKISQQAFVFCDPTTTKRSMTLQKCEKLEAFFKTFYSAP